MLKNLHKFQSYEIFLFFIINRNKVMVRVISPISLIFGINFDRTMQLGERDSYDFIQAAKFVDIK